MKKLSKRFLTLAIACVMAMAMAVPAFASGYRPNGYGNYFLNINGTTGTAYQGRVVNLMHTSTVGTDQNFTIGTRSGFTGYYMKVTANPAYAVNRSTNGGRAIIWPLSSGATDSRLYDASSTVIRLNSTRELLTAREPVGDWSQVYFGGSGIAGGSKSTDFTFDNQIDLCDLTSEKRRLNPSIGFDRRLSPYYVSRFSTCTNTIYGIFG